MTSTVRKMMVAAVLAGMLALTMAPAFAGTTASPDDTARFLAGLPPAADSPLAPLANDPDWQQHAHSFNALFAREDANTLSKVRAFSAAHLGTYHDAMLYFFSGPDFLYATSFFPHASTYVMAGLEPAGDIPQLTELSRGSLDQTLQNLQVSLKTILNISFFITKDMQSQLNEGQVFGTLPVLYVFLARTGKTVHEASFVSLDAQGNFVTPNDHPPANVTRGVKIVFSDGNGPNQTLYYFSTDLGNDGVKQSGFLAFCAKLGTADSFIKSNSYLLHGENFSKSAISCSSTAAISCKTTAAFRSLISTPRNGSFCRSAIISAPWGSSPEAASRSSRNCSAMPPHSTSASATAGKRTLRT